MNSFWGDIPSWSLVIIALVAAIIGLNQYKDQVQVSKQNGERLRREQASCFAVWWVIELKKPQTDPASGGQNGRWGVLLRNSSLSTFTNVQIQTKCKEVLSTVTMYTLPPGDVFLPWNPEGSRSKFDFSYPEYVPNVSGDFNPVNSHTYEVESVSFSDNEGRRWMVDKGGKLSEVSVESMPLDSSSEGTQ